MARLVDLPSLVAAEERFCASDSIDGGGPSSHQWLDPSPSHAPQATTYCKLDLLGSGGARFLVLVVLWWHLSLTRDSVGNFGANARIQELRSSWPTVCVNRRSAEREEWCWRRNQEREEREGGTKRFPTDRYGPHVRENIGSEFLVICFNSV